jgi:hypothetical protein
VKDALASGARILAMSDWSDEMFISPALLETDFHAQAEACRRLGAPSLRGCIFISPRRAEQTFISRVEGAKPT